MWQTCIKIIWIYAQINLLISKVSSPRDDNFSENILDVIDLDSYLLEAKESVPIKLTYENFEIAPVLKDSAGHIVNSETDTLFFNDIEKLQ